MSSVSSSTTASNLEQFADSAPSLSPQTTLIKDTWTANVRNMNSSSDYDAATQSKKFSASKINQDDTLATTCGIVGGAVGASMGALIAGGSVVATTVSAGGNVAMNPFFVPTTFIGISYGSDFGYQTGYSVGQAISTIRSRL